MDGFTSIASGVGLVGIMCESVLPSLADAFVQNFGETVSSHTHGTGCDATGQENQFRCVQYGKQGTDHVPLTRWGACKTSRYCSKGCQVEHRTVHKPVCMAIQELGKQKAAEDGDDDLNTTFHLMPREQAGLKKLVGRRCMVKCLITGKAEMEALRDTRLQVCAMSRKWQQTRLPLEI